MTSTHTTWFNGPVGTLETDIDLPQQCTRGIAFLAHPLTTAGGNKNHKVITTMSRALVEAGYITVRPNLRGAGRSDGVYDGGIGETEDFMSVVQQSFELHAVAELLPFDGQVVFGGFSFGTYVALLASSVRKPAAVLLAGAACSLFDLPHPQVPTFLFHGQNDEVIPLNSVLAWANVQNTPVSVLPQSDHFFTNKLALLKNGFSRALAVI